MNYDKALNIRVSSELCEKLNDYCWENRLRIATFIREVLEEKMNEIEANGGNK